MKRLKEKKNLYIFIFYIILVGLIPITLFFSNSIGETMDQHIIDTMENSAELCVEMVEGRYETDMQMIESLAVQLSLSFDEPERAMERMSSFAERYGMKRVAFSYPDGVTLTTNKMALTVSGIDKQQVGQVAAEIRSFKKPEPYKGKGIKYADEVILRKAGKAGK